MKRETRHKITLLPKLRAIPDSWWVKVQQVSVRGTPDILGCVAGAFVALEQKVDGKSAVAPLQLHTLSLIRGAGGFGEIIYRANEDEIIGEIREKFKR